ncbi:MAG: hypothetical protein Q8O15_04750, partial [Rectinemataceae bacterium]|nr:hypothetical protein [Rectinemataceae bacterium]
MLNSIVIVRKGRTGIVRRIDKNTFHLSCVFRLKRLQGEKVVAEYELVVEEVDLIYAVRRMVALGGVFDEDSRLEAGAGLFADPGEFEF